MTILTLPKQQVRIDQGELVGYLVDGHELIHQKGNPGWRNSDTEMFPIIGPTNEADFKVKTPRGEAFQDQHGLLRELEYELLESTETKAVFEKRYQANTPIKNSKYPGKSAAPELFWPYDFNFKKAYHLKEDGLEICFEIEGEDGMPFMLGYHPAFNLATEHPIIKTHEKEISIPEVMAVGSRALQVPKESSIILNDQLELTIKTEGFEHFMLWTEVPNMVCIEPITFYPYAVEQANLDTGFSYLEGGTVKRFKVFIYPI
ncbi:MULTISPECIES: aldose 1-epimerase [Maribacter]|uniref:Aldose 1-epimerase n=1 Tax=Maribacter flavus TaxID=1658664 RepID=A0ABU7II85_9FLAO|nr:MULTISPECIES: aldose 1-epimerase [Maribacter]MDC6404917.1 aldose 1-epimerase [Maribacter sp. PR66]MEE1972331.1 aldose 1-epimerase [Maribacter flavus]